MSASAQQVQPSATMLRYPAVSESRVAFVYAGQVWTAPKSGGTAIPIASPVGQAGFPKFSPDGKSIAFVANYDGGRDIYTVGTEGGVPRRVTHHPGNESISQWTSDDQLVFVTTGFGGLQRQSQLLVVSPEGGMPTKLPMAYAGFGSLSPDGEWVAFTPHSTDNRTWKRYRGGMATDVWLLNLKTKESRQITDWEGTDTLPMFGFGREGGATVYYLSDAGPEHRLNIWSYSIASGERKQLTSFKDDDVRWPSAGPNENRGRGDIVFQLGAKLMILDLDTRETRAIRVSIPGARPKIADRTENAGETIQSASLSPSGKRVVLSARGDIWSVPAKEGVTRNLTQSGDVFERGATWSPDGRWIAYLSDKSGEYELWVRPSDARPEFKDAEKKDAEKKDAEKKDAESKDTDKPVDSGSDIKPSGPRGPVKLTNLGTGFRQNLTWSPDSKHIAFTDHIGNLQVVSLKIEGESMTGDFKQVDKDPWSEDVALAWAHDSSRLAYTRADDGNSNECIWFWETLSGEKHRVTSPMFAARSPAFDRKGEFFYYISRSDFGAPMYADMDTTFIYGGTDRIHMVPLRGDVAIPLAPKTGDEEVKPEKDAKKKDGTSKTDKAPEKTPGAQKDAKPDDGVSGTWTGTADGVPDSPGPVPFTLKIRIDDNGSISGNILGHFGAASVSGSYQKDSGSVVLNFSVNGSPCSMSGTLKDKELSGSWSFGEAAGGPSGAFKASRSAAWSSDDDKEEGKKEDGGANDGASKSKPLVVELQGFEERAIRLPMSAGNYANLAVSHDGKLLYVVGGVRGSQDKPNIKIFDPKDDTKEEKVVAADARGFDISADGKKLLVQRGRRLQIVDPVAGGGKAQDVSTSGLRVMINPREEWKQIFDDAWRIQRDYFYVDNMHGVDWNALRTHYGAMIEDAASREDVHYIIGELISELNIGHAYVQNPGDIGPQPSNVAVGMLGCDFALENGAYRISHVLSGGPWDADARSPLAQGVHPQSGKPVKVKAGQYVLEVNGVRIDAKVDPWRAFIGMADKPTLLTISDKPEKDAGAYEVLVTPMGSDSGLRFRDWIERNRKYVEEKSGGKVAYVYVPNTGVDGQNELYRQFFAQRQLPGMIIDERWNGGGQIPTRFIEILNRPVTNYWARRGFNDWTWPPDAHVGVKCMLINGLAGSGGDMFPWLFKANHLGKLIGTRTWGGLVGISGNPGFIDGGSMTSPTFGFYEKDGTWGVEGHGTDPDMLVVDDPGKMLDGGDPQLDAAIQHVLSELQQSPVAVPSRPASPNRSGMGIPDADR